MGAIVTAVMLFLLGLTVFVVGLVAHVHGLTVFGAIVMLVGPWLSAGAATAGGSREYSR